MFKLFLNVKEILEKNKPIPFVNCKAKFNQMTQTSLVPFKQSLVFRIPAQDSPKYIDLTFEKNLKEIGEVSIEVKSEYLVHHFETEKLFQIERLDSNVKTYAKIFLVVLDYSQDNIATKSKNYFDRKSLTSSPRTNPKMPKSGTLIMQHDHPSKHFDSDYESISLLKHHPNVEQAPSIALKSSSKTFFFNQPEKFKLNLHELSKEARHNDDLPLSKDLKSSTKLGKASKENKAMDALTSRDTEGGQTKRPHFRKTKSLEKLRNQRLQNTKKYNNFFVMKEHQFDSKEKSQHHMFETFDHESKDFRSSGKKEKSLDATKKNVHENSKELEKVLKEANTRLLKENNKFEHLIMSIQKLRDKYESEYIKHAEQLESYSGRCKSLERNLYLMNNELIMWKSKAELINLLEQEVDNLRGALDEQGDRHVETHQIVTKKTNEMERIIDDLELENNECSQRIVYLESENEKIKAENLILNQKRNELIFDNNVLKAKVVSLEINEELVKLLTYEKEALGRENKGLRQANQELKEILDIHRKSSVRFEEDAHFITSVDALKERVSFINQVALSSLEDVNNYFNVNFDLRNNIDFMESSGEDSDSTIEPRTSIRSEKAETKRLAAHVERNLERINSFIENNKKLEKCLFTAVNDRNDRRGDSSAKKKIREARSSAGSLNQSQTSSQTGRIKSARAYDQRKLSYTPTKVCFLFKNGLV